MVRRDNPERRHDIVQKAYRTPKRSVWRASRDEHVSANLECVSFSDGRDRIGMRRLGYELTLKSELGLIHI